MTRDMDHYEVYYADKLWNLLPAVYRAEDTDNFDSHGPLREMVDRIGVQAAILRRSIDRLWEDQSIETCDDWLIPYIGDLLATNLVSNLDSRSQRLDVANTINYRRRKGTLSLLEELAADITGWDARVVEFFRRLGRTRHGLDPEIGLPVKRGDDIDKLQLAEGLAGPLTRTLIGGTANLRNVYGASKAHTAFDEFFHTADFRRGSGQLGWHNIPRLGVFLWRLKSFGLPPTTPVPVTDCANWFTFDPTGRDIPLFVASSRRSDFGGNRWVSPVEEQLPGPISHALYDSNMAQRDDRVIELYSNSLKVLRSNTPQTDDDLITADGVEVRPERGRFEYVSSPPQELRVTYHYGFSSEIGAGPYDRRLGRQAPPTPEPLKVSGGGNALTAVGLIPSTGILALTDSLTYTDAPTVSVNGTLTTRAENKQRPLIRLPAGSGAWKFSGDGNENNLVLDGLFVSGGDIILAGKFQSVTITCCTLDPGSAAPINVSPPGPFATAADGRQLTPTRLWVEGQIGTLLIERSIIGPIQTRGDGKIGTLCINHTIIQALYGSVPSPLGSPLSPPADFIDAAIALDDGEVCLSNCTVLGVLKVHRLFANECILQDIVRVNDAQHGCVRFTAWATASVLPRKYESVEIPRGVPLFTSMDFGQPGFCQLLPTADAAILPDPLADGATPNTISAGSQDGSEMGAFARERNPIKERGLLIKYHEFMPVGLVPVVVYVT